MDFRQVADEVGGVVIGVAAAAYLIKLFRDYCVARNTPSIPLPEPTRLEIEVDGLRGRLKKQVADFVKNRAPRHP